MGFIREVPIKQTINKEGLGVNLYLGSVTQILDRKWDFIFMDPPYHFEPLFWLEKASSKVQKILIFEHSCKTNMPSRVHELYKSKSKRYGDSMLTFYKPGVRKD